MSHRRQPQIAPQNSPRSVPLRERGYSLIEMMACLSISSIILTLSVQLMQRTMRLSGSAREQAQAQLTAVRLATQFRTDVQQGKNVRLVADPVDVSAALDGAVAADAWLATATLAIEGAGPQALEWRATPANVERVRYLEDGRVHRERYLFPDDFRIELGLLDEPKRAFLSVVRSGDAVGVAPRVLRRFEAVVGRNPVAANEPEALP